MQCSNEIVVDLSNIKPIKGWGWSNNYLGWLRLSNDSLREHSPFIRSNYINGVPPNEELLEDNINYGLYFVTTTNSNIPNFKGYIVGQAWNDRFGWLYFENYNNDKCPTQNSSGQDLGEQNCFAYVVEENVNGVKMLKVKGWARFENLKNVDGMNPWVSLSKKANESDYGLYLFYNPKGYYELRGFAWNQHFGWLGFGGQMITKVEFLGITPDQEVKLKIHFTNFIPYENKVLLYYKTSTNADFVRHGLYSLLSQGSHVIDNVILNPNTYYLFKLFSK